MIVRAIALADLHGEVFCMVAVVTDCKIAALCNIRNVSVLVSLISSLLIANDGNHRNYRRATDTLKPFTGVGSKAKCIQRTAFPSLSLASLLTGGL